jgi:hypothetical protein
VCKRGSCSERSRCVQSITPSLSHACFHTPNSSLRTTIDRPLPASTSTSNTNSPLYCASTRTLNPPPRHPTTPLHHHPIMPTAVEQQQQQGPSPGECDTIGKGVFSKIIDAMPASPEQKDEHDLAGLTTNLDLKDHETEPIPIAKPTTTKPGHDETASKATNENFDPKLAHATTAPQPECEPIEVTGIDRTALATVSNDSFTLTSHIAATKSELGPDHDETSSPGLGTYIRLHNDVNPSLPLPITPPTN